MNSIIEDRVAPHTPEWWEGYYCQAPLRHNPYKKEYMELFGQWELGWFCRFYGEEP